MSTNFYIIFRSVDRLCTRHHYSHRIFFVTYVILTVRFKPYVKQCIESQPAITHNVDKFLRHFQIGRSTLYESSLFSGIFCLTYVILTVGYRAYTRQCSNLILPSRAMPTIFYAILMSAYKLCTRPRYSPELSFLLIDSWWGWEPMYDNAKYLILPSRTMSTNWYAILSFADQLSTRPRYSSEYSFLLTLDSRCGLEPV